MTCKDQIDQTRLPQHIAIIMDGNGRWAKDKGKHRIFGHTNGVESVRQVSEACAELGVRYLTLYAFSTENWNRPKLEVQALMELLLKTIRSEIDTLNKNNIRLRAIGNISALPEFTRKELAYAVQATEKNNRLDLILALSYGSKDEILHAVRELAAQVADGKLSPAEIEESHLRNFLYTREIPDPELLIRTSGEQRISNFLLWQLAYAEFFFSDTFWPDFRKDDLYRAILDYQMRERRFGKISEQIISP